MSVEDFRMGFDAGTRSCQNLMQLRIDDLTARLAAAEARIVQLEARENTGMDEAI